MRLPPFQELKTEDLYEDKKYWILEEGSSDSESEKWTPKDSSAIE